MRRRCWIVIGFAISYVAIFVATIAWSAETNDTKPNSVELDFFETKIRPVLVERCYSCHSAKAQAAGKLKGGLQLDTRHATRAGGDSGPAVIPQSIDGSLLIEALRYGEDSFQMPPNGKLADEIIADFEHWVQAGAVDPRDGIPSSARKGIDWDAARKFWSFQPPRSHSPPIVKDKTWSRTTIDPFVLAKIEAAGLQVASPESRHGLLQIGRAHV